MIKILSQSWLRKQQVLMKVIEATWAKYLTKNYPCDSWVNIPLWSVCSDTKLLLQLVEKLLWDQSWAAYSICFTYARAAFLWLCSSNLVWEMWTVTVHFIKASQFWEAFSGESWRSKKLENAVWRWSYCHMLAVKIALILIQKDSDQEDDVVWEVEAVELRKTGKSKKEK